MTVTTDHCPVCDGPEPLHATWCGPEQKEPLPTVERTAGAVRLAEQQTSKLRVQLVRAMRDAYGPHTLQQIADAAGISRQRVSQLLQD